MVTAAEPQSIEVLLDGAVVTRVQEYTEFVELRGNWTAEPTSHEWRQTRGPRFGLEDLGFDSARLDLGGIEVAAPTTIEIELMGPSCATCLAGPTATVSLVIEPIDLTPVLGPNVQLGGSSEAVAGFDDGEGRWMAYGTGNRLSVTRVATAREERFDLHLPGFVHDIRIVEYETVRYALVAMGTYGLGVVDVSNPMTPTFVDSVRLDHYQGGLMFAEGGGAILVDEEISSENSPITSLETDGVTLWLGNEGYGIHRVALASVLGEGGIVREEDGTLAVDHEAYLLQYAGENPWGRPESIKLVEGRLFVARGFLGLGIYDPTTLERVGGYNLYTDASVVEDWFIDMDVAEEVQSDPVSSEPFLDAVTGMPDYRQANFEIEQVWHGDVEAPTPWAEFDRYARYYYMARAVDVASYEDTDIAYIAYGLGGLVAVDITGFAEATSEAPVTGTWLGYAPAVPAHGPDMPTYGETDSLYPHYGFGKLAEAGVGDVTVHDGVAWFSDHFAGLVGIGGADDPAANWHGVNGAGAYDNDDPTIGDGVLGDHWPDYEFVTSYDMSPWDEEDHESLPQWMYESPAILVTGEVIGHGNAFLIEPGFNGYAAGQVDVIQAAGSGGLATLDIVDLTAPDNGERFQLQGWYASTDELGMAPNGTVSAPINIGHTQGVTSSDRYLYVGDGPHGVTAWEIADADGVPLDTIRLVGNTLQAEYAVTVGEVTIHPATHASNVVYHAPSQSVLSLSQSIGLRRVPVADIEAGLGAPGAPLLLQPQATDLFEHNTRDGSVEGLDGQDHAYDAIVEGDLAFVADGSNGLTVYDLTLDPTDLESGFFVGNIGGESSASPALGRATGIELWTDPDTGTRYAFVAAGQRGIGVVDATDPTNMTFVKVFEPIKLEDETIGKADGRCVDVRVIGDVVWLSYSSFGLVAYAIEDLIAPVPDGVDPLEIWSKGSEETFDHRPVALDRLDLTDEPGYEDADYEFLYMDSTHVDGEVMLYLAAGGSGLVIVDGTDSGDLQLVTSVPTVHEATAVQIVNGRVYVADHSGGVAAFR